MKKYVAMLLIMLLLFASPANAQLNLTYTSFQPGQSISAAQFTANFTAISSNALNRTGGTMTGTLTTNAGVDVNGSFTIGSDNIQPFDSTGRIKEFSAAYFADATINETDIADGLVYPRIAANESISGVWTFLSSPTLNGENILSGTIPETAIADGLIYARIGANETISGGYQFSGGLTISGSTSLGVNGAFQLMAFPSPVAGRIFIGDGTGYRMHISSRAASTNFDKFTFYDTGRLDITGALYVGGNTFELTGVAPGMYWSQNGASADERYWLAVVDANVWQLRTYNDTQTLYDTAISIARAGYGVSSVSFYHPVIMNSSAAVGTSFSAGTTITAGGQINGASLNISGAASVTGNLTVSGSFSAGSLQFADGSVGAPSIAFTNDTNTGFYRSGADTFAVVSGGTTMMTFNSGILINVPTGVSIQANWITPNFGAGAKQIGTSTALYDGMYALAFHTTSDRRAKQDISELDLGIEFIDSLKPVNYRFVKDPSKIRYGFVAQDLVKLGFAGVDTSNPNNYTLNYNEFIAPMVKGMQDMHRELHTLETQNKVLQAEIEFLVKRVKVLEKGYGGRIAD